MVSGGFRTLAGAALALLALGGCATGAGGGGGGKKSLTLVQGIKSDPFYITMGCGAKAEAAKENVNLDVQGPDQFQVAPQTALVNSVAANRPNGVLIAPVDATAMITPLRQLQQAGSKVVLVDTTVADPSIGVSRISSDNALGGQKAADTLATLAGGHGKVLVVSVQAGIATTDARERGFRQELAKHPGMQLVDVRYDGDDPSQAASITDAVLAATPDLAGIFATNLNSGEGVVTGLRNAGKLGKVKVVGFDASPKEAQDLSSGAVQALIAQDPYAIGQQGVRQALAAINGKPVTAAIKTDMVAITRDGLVSGAMNRYLYKASC